MVKNWSWATLTNVSYERTSFRSALGLVAPSMPMRMLYRPPLSNMGPTITGLWEPSAYRAPGALMCSEP